MIQTTRLEETKAVFVHQKSSIDPFLKWAGGKRWATRIIANLVPENYCRYIEPFLGGGSVFFALAPQEAILSDANSELIGAYQTVRDGREELERCLAWLHTKHSKALYYAVRERDFSLPILRAAKFIHLNRTCWNGLHRVNRSGKFNVPIGTKTQINFENGLSAQSSALANAILQSCDFEETLDRSDCGDFVYVDPPYTVKHNNNGFLKYNEKIFSWEDQERLAAAVMRAKARGACVLVSNANHQSVRDLFSPLGKSTVLSRSSVIAGISTARGVEKELETRKNRMFRAWQADG